MIQCINQRDFSHLKAAVFDFDGTLSFLRNGWETAMKKTMTDFLRGGFVSDTELDLLINRYIEESTGIQTVYQMEWLKEKVKEIKGTEPLSVWHYKDVYNDELMEMINSRKTELAASPDHRDRYIMPGSLQFLERLIKKKVRILFASGTDDPDVKNEASLLGLADFADVIKGAPPRQYGCSKEAVIDSLINERHFSGDELLIVGDGKVEIALGKKFGAITIGIAGNNDDSGFINPGKSSKLINAGADYIVPDLISARVLII